MKKVLSLALLTTLILSMSAIARVQYDSTGRKIIYDDTIRGQRRAEERAENYKKIQAAAAAARIDYEKYMYEINDNNLKSNYYQKRN